MDLAVESVTLRLREPVRAAWGTLTERVVLQVLLEADDGLVGRGEAAPLEPYDGVPLAAVGAALDAYAELAQERGEEELLEACRAERDLPQALAAVDLALWDLAGKRAGRSVAELISVEAARSIPVNATVGAEDRAGAAAAAAAAAQADFDTIKVKVGDRRRRRAARRGAGRDRAAGGDPRRRQRRVGRRPGGRVAARARAGGDRAGRGAGPRRRGAARGARRGRRAAGDGRDRRRGGRRRAPAQPTRCA